MKSREVNKPEENFAKSFVTFRFVEATHMIGCSSVRESIHRASHVLSEIRWRFRHVCYSVTRPP